jgi:Ni/Co efflux regulator RcnB
MKYIITAVLALCLAGGAAAAQDRDHDRGGRGGGHEERRGGPPGGDRGFDRGNRGDRGDRGERRFDRGDRGGFDRDRGRGFERRGPEPGFRPGFYLRDHGWRGGGRFRAPFYRYPSGWGYRRWAFGAFLPGAFLAPDYFIGSYWTYGLPAPPPGYHWIRVGPDALLVRYGDGYVLDAVYGIFY